MGRHRAPSPPRNHSAALSAVVAIVFTAVVVLGGWQFSGQFLRAGSEPAPTPAPTPMSTPTSSVRPTPAPTPTATAEATPSPAVAPVTVPEFGSGEFRVAGVPGEVAYLARGPGTASGVSRSYTVEVERDLSFAPREVAGVVDRVLAHSRGWRSQGYGFARTAGQGDLRILLATPTTTDRLCAPLQTRGQVSCRNGSNVVLNARRWAEGIPDYAGHLAEYRRYLVNHEVGHALGKVHVYCPGPGQPAPVMMQQTYGLKGCARNPWP